MSLDRLQELANKARASLPKNQNVDWFSFKNQDEETPDIYIYGPIGTDFGEEDLTARNFVRQLNEITSPSLNLHINSPGGLVFDGVAIYSALKNHEASVNVSIDGVAASAASFVAMAGDSIGIEKPAKMMIHDAHGLVIGNSAFMRKMADLYDEFSDTIADIYATRSGRPKNQMRKAMQAETWYSSSEAVNAGLADKVLNEGSAENRNSQLIRARHSARTGGK